MSDTQTTRDDSNYLILYGLPEGLVGESVVHADSIESLLREYPVLGAIESKLSFQGNTVVGFAACDG